MLGTIEAGYVDAVEHDLNLLENMPHLRFLLLQIRKPTDPMRTQEVNCFARAIGCEVDDVDTFDLLGGFPTADDFSPYDAVLIGGSGDYSAADDSPWLESTLAGLRAVHAARIPTFASCWGFQAFARALGGRCIHDPPFAELGTIDMHLTEAGRDDPLFGQLPAVFPAQAGHEDHVVELPPNARLLASSDRVANQAFRFVDAPIYCTQFHPELDRDTLLQRIEVYSAYLDRIIGIPFEEFKLQCRETPQAAGLLKRFDRMVAELKTAAR